MKTLTALTLFVLSGLASASETPECNTDQGFKIAYVHRLTDAIVSQSDPDWLAVVEKEAADAVTSGEWSARMKAHERFLKRWATDPDLPPSRPQTEASRFSVRSTGFRLGTADERPSVFLDGRAQTLDAAFPTEAFANFSRLYLFFDATRPNEIAFAKKLLEALPRTARLRPVITGGSLRATEKALGLRLYADQGGSLTRRLRLENSPSLVRLTPETIAVYTPALDADGIPPEPLPQKATGLSRPLDLSRHRRPQAPRE